VQEPVLRISEGLTPSRRRSETTLDGPENSSGRSGNTQDTQRPRTFKPRRPEIGTWKTNTFKATGQLVKSGLTFDQLLSKYVKNKADPNDRLAKRPRSPTQERQQIRPIGPPHQLEKDGKSYCSVETLHACMDASTPISTYAISIYIHTTTICPESHVEHETISIWDATVPHLRGTRNICIQQIGTSSTGPIEHHSIRSLGTSPARLPDHSTAKADQSGRGHIHTATERTTKKDIIKIGTTDVVIQENNEGAMIFGESANTNKTEDTTSIKIADPKYSMPRWCPSGLTRSQKRKLQHLRAKENQEKEAEKIFNDTHPQYPHRKRGGV
jgi:hypothetical protein